MPMLCMRLSLRVPVPATARTYATRRPERPPLKIKDPLSSPNATHHRVTPSLTFIHRPPPTAPSPFSLTTAPSSPLLLPRPTSTVQASDAPDAPSSSTRPHLPPLMKRPVEKPVQRLSGEQLEEMRKLRASDPLKYTRIKLAKQFGCSPYFVPIAAPLSNAEKRTALQRRDQSHEAIRSRWGEKKKMAVAIRQKRRQLW